MTPYPHQIELAEQVAEILKKHALVYIACEERTGKTLIAMLAIEGLRSVTQVLVITKKQAIQGWRDTLQAMHGKLSTGYTVVNYHQVNKQDRKDYDLIILDESHNYISGFPKPSMMWSEVARLTVGTPLIYISATPYAQGYQLLYHQLALSTWSPWNRYRDAYEWFEEYGIPKSIWISGRQIQQYTQIEDRCFEDVKHLFITKTRKEIGFEHEPEDVVHYIELAEQTKLVYNTITKDRSVVLNDWNLVCDSIMKLRTSLHMIEGGVMLVSTIDVGKKALKRNYIVLGNTEKIDYIKAKWGDTKKMVIMYHYIAEGNKLRAHFENAEILQATTYAEGTDLYEYEYLIIYSQDFNTAKFTQRRARQANQLRETEIKVHHLLVKDAISSEVYQAVSINKQNYIDRLYGGNLL